MERLEIESCLKSMIILVDTREQPSDKAKKRYAAFPCPYRRQTLDYGDYTYSFTLPDGSEFIPDGIRAKGSAVIERKMGLEELSSCFTHDRKRFEAEFERAKDNGSAIYLLTENATWENLINGRYGTKFSAKSFFSSITAFMARYQMSVVFCKSETSGKMIHQILYRELKERLERGEYG